MPNSSRNQAETASTQIGTIKREYNHYIQSLNNTLNRLVERYNQLAHINATLRAEIDIHPSLVALNNGCWDFHQRIIDAQQEAVRIQPEPQAPLQATLSEQEQTLINNLINNIQMLNTNYQQAVQEYTTLKQHKTHWNLKAINVITYQLEAARQQPAQPLPRLNVAPPMLANGWERYVNINLMQPPPIPNNTENISTVSTRTLRSSST